MKKIMEMGLSIALLLSLISCGNHGQAEESSSSEANLSVPQEAGSTNISENTELTALFTLGYAPVASSEGSFIVRNESGNLYGLLDETGAVILPCEYDGLSFQKTKNQVVLKVMSRGSCGVFDLEGNELIPCEYTEIEFSPYDDFCIVRTFVDKLGAINFQNETVLPIEFDVMDFGYGKVIATATETSEAGVYTVDTYNLNGELLGSFLWNEGPITSFQVGSDGGSVWIKHNQKSYGLFSINGGETVWGGMEIVENYVFYVQGGELHVRDMNTQEDSSIWTFPNAEDYNSFYFLSSGGDTSIDPETGSKSIDLEVQGVLLNSAGIAIEASEEYYLRVLPDQSFEVIDCNALGLNISILGGDELGPFNDGIAMVFPSSGYLYTINTDGETVQQLTNPYTSRSSSFLLKNAAVLDNNGFYSIVDVNGDILLSETGYSGVEELDADGLYAVTDQNGMVGVINDYAEEVIPCGGVNSADEAVQYLSFDAYEEWNLESSYRSVGELFIINYENKWAVYSETAHRVVTDFQESATEHSPTRENILGNGGYALIDEEADTAYAVVYNDESGSYEVSILFDLATMQ